MQERSASPVCYGFGPAVPVPAGVMGPMLPKDGGGFAEGFGAPVSAFDWADSTEDLQQVFGLENGRRHAGRIAEMNAGNRRDSALVAVDGASLCSFFVAV